MDILELHNVSFERYFMPLFTPIDCKISSGDMVQIHGENGSGKSTLLRILAGLIETSIGKCYWQGACIYKTGHIYQQALHYIGHQNGCKPYLTVYENLRLFQILQMVHSQSSDIERIITLCGLAPISHIKAALLSAGQLRRLNLARLFLSPKKIWLLDEPSTALDNKGQQWLEACIDAHLDQQGIVILATHEHWHSQHPMKTIHLKAGPIC